MTHHHTARRFAPRAHLLLLASAITAWSMPALAQSRPERLSDKDVKALIAQVDEGRDKFEGNLDGDFKGSTLNGPNGEIKVSAALQDYQDNTQKLKDRFTPDYSAGPEVATVLRQSAIIDAFMQRSASTMKGRSEWDRQAVNLRQLAAAYGTSFPQADGAGARRMNDKETGAVATAIATAAARVKGDIDKTTTLAKPDRDGAKEVADLLVKRANAVKSRLSDGRPATSELQQVVEQTARLEAFLVAHPIPTTSNWQAVQASVAKLQQAFGTTP